MVPEDVTAKSMVSLNVIATAPEIAECDIEKLCLSPEADLGLLQHPRWSAL